MIASKRSRCFPRPNLDLRGMEEGMVRDGGMVEGVGRRGGVPRGGGGEMEDSRR